ncbi:hypothetical protein WA026_015279 [Henosepilachna vigintioctopunctata]|uniref:Uncharacterized protein n=1 Tax=Henosepilachna vigintioctopunctata TaxID=420089 RepID=A0AAW1TW29_9CUCU
MDNNILSFHILPGRPRYFIPHPAPFAIIHGFQRPVVHYTEYDLFNVTKDGVFSTHSQNEDSFVDYGVETDAYCMEYAYKKSPENRTLDEYGIFVKYDYPTIGTTISVTRWVKIVSCVFLLLTIIVYAILSKLRNLFGKIIMSYSVAMFMTFFMLTISQFFQQYFSDNFCKFVGFYLIFSSFCCFTWMQIICIDIWYSFG